MKKICLFIFIMTGTFAGAQSFSPVVVKTNKYKLYESAGFKSDEADHKECAVATSLNQSGDAILFRMGVIGSTASYFGWDMEIPLKDFPLKKGYQKTFATPGLSTMLLSYDGTQLKFQWVHKSGLWNMIYPFTLTVDSELKTVKSFKGNLMGYDTNIFGNPVNHISEDCQF